MKCAELRAMAESYLAGELPVDTNHEVITHLERCADCRGELNARIQLRLTLRRAFLQSEALAPGADFTERVRASLRADAGSRRRWIRGLSPWMAVAAGVALLLILGWQLWNVSRQPAISSWAAALGAHAVGDHRDCALHHALDELPISLDEAGRRYNPAYAAIRDVIAGSLPVREGAVEILGAHWCVFRGRPFVHVIVQHRGHTASILLTPVDQAPPSLASAEACPPSEGFRVACFGVRGHAGFVVSDLADRENLELAREFAPVLQAHLAQARTGAL